MVVAQLWQALPHRTSTDYFNASHITPSFV